MTTPQQDLRDLAKYVLAALNAQQEALSALNYDSENRCSVSDKAKDFLYESQKSISLIRQRFEHKTGTVEGIFGTNASV